MTGIVWRQTGWWWLPAAAAGLVTRIRSGGRKEEACRRRYCGMVSLLCLLAFMTGIIRYESMSRQKEAYQPYLKDGTEAVLCGVIWKKETKNEQSLIYLKHTSLQVDQKVCRTGLVLAYLSDDSYPIGTTLYIKGTIKAFRHAVNDGGYDEKSYYKAKNIDYAFEAKKVLRCVGDSRFLAEALYQLRKRLTESICKNAKDKTAGILAVMTLGEKSVLDQEVKEQYQKAGISHVLVISGLHISMLGMGIYQLLRKCKRGVTAAALASFLLLSGYGCMVGNGASTMRAVIMFSVAMGGRIFGRAYDRATALALAVGVLVWQNPFLLLNAGFQFSVAAVSGVILSQVNLAQQERARSWQVNGCISLMTLPLAMYYYYEVPIYSLLVNLVVLPLIAPVVAFGLAGAVIGVRLEGPAHFLLLIPHVLLQIVSACCEMVSRLPYAGRITGRPELWRIVVFYLLLLTCVLWKHKLRCRKRKKQKNVGYKERIKTVIVNGMLVLILYLVLIIRINVETRIDFLDVGQGDGICIRTGTGVTLFIDGGSSNVSEVGRYRILPYLKYHGIQNVDAWFVSHADKDHISGLTELLEEGYPVSKLILGATPEQDEQVSQLCLLAEHNKTQVLIWKKGSRLQMGKSSMTCVFPAERDMVEDSNGNSLVLLYEEGSFRALFTGDTTKEQEQKMLAQQVAGQIDLYKTAHHGSNYSNSKEWLSYLSPQVSVVSCSQKNRYGHPGKEAVERIKETGSRLYYTMKSRQITVGNDKRGIWVKEYVRFP